MQKKLPYKKALTESVLLHLDCPECNTPIKSENVNLDKGVGKCHYCNAIFELEPEIPFLRNKPLLNLPKGVEMLRLREEIELKYQWRKNKSNFFLFFALFWNAMLIPFIVSILMSGAWFMLVFMSIHLLVGLGMLYGALANLINTSYITANRNYLSIEHYPLKMPFQGGDKNIPADNIRQLFVEKYKNGSTNGKPNYAYRLKAITKNNHEQVLLRGFRTAEPLQFIEQEIEDFLKIKDSKVSSEWR